MLAGDIARSFSHDRPHRLNSRCNTELARMQDDGRVRRSHVTEPSAYYRNIPAYRWFITAAGRRQLEERTRAAARRNAEQEARAELQRIRERAPLIAARVLATGCTVRRNASVRELAARGLTRTEIANAFGISRERVRQLAEGSGRQPTKPRPCLCAECRARRLEQTATGAGFAFEGENMTEDEVREALASVFGEHAARVIGAAAIPAATGVDRAPGLPPADGCAGGRIIALDWYHQPDRFRLRIPAHSPGLVRELTDRDGREAQ